MTNSEWGAVLTGATGIATSILAKSEYNKNMKAVNSLNTQIAELEASRVAIENPYDAVQDTSGSLTNPYANMSVATNAAKFQAEEADIALANTLDTMRALGQGAGGATALAQAALKSKRDVSASIEQQEVNNEKMRVAGEEKLQLAKQAEAQRLQTAEVEGEKFMFAEQDKRDLQKLDRTQAQLDQERANAANSQAAMFGAISDTMGGLSTILAGTPGKPDESGFKFDPMTGKAIQ